MKKLLRIALGGITGLLVLGFVAYRLWFYNPYRDTLRLDPASVFGAEGSAKGLLIRHATLIDVVDGEAVPEAHLLIRGETIAEVIIGDESEAAVDLEVDEAQHKYVIPGLFAGHVHLAMHPHLITGDFGPRDSLVTKAALEQFVRYGVTTGLVLGGGGAKDEQGAELKRLERSNALVAPLLFATGDLITAPGSHPITTVRRLPADTEPARLHQAGVTVIGPAEEPSPLIAKKKRLGLDGMKIILEAGPPPWHPNPRMSVETASKIIDQAAKHDLPVYAHVESYAEFADAVRIGVDGVMHSVSDTLIDDGNLIARIKREGIYCIPTLSLFYGFQYLEKPARLEDDFLQAGVSQRTLRALEHPLFRFGFGRTLSGHDVSKWLATSMRNLVRLHEAGVKVALGTDASSPFNFPGYGVHIEMELMARAGLSNAEVLRTATINGADFLGIAERVGTLAPGKIANLLVLAENPLTDIRNTRTLDRVILKGHVLDPSDRAAANGDT